MSATLILYGGGRFWFLTRKKRKFSPLKEIGLLLFAVFLSGLLSQAILPRFILQNGTFVPATGGEHTTNFIPFRVFGYTFSELFLHRNFTPFLINFLGNILLFCPIGFCLPLFWGFSEKQTLLLGFSLSLFIEICQLFQPRSSDVDDLILNTLGVFLGLLLFKALRNSPNFHKL